MNIIITDAGLAAIANAEQNGTLPLTIAQVALGSGLWTPDATATGLQNEIKRIDTVAGGNPAPDQLYAEILDDSDDVYSLGEIGFYWSDGTLLAIYSQTTPIQDKAELVPLLLSCDIALTSVPANSLTFGDTNFRYPPATESTRGVAEVATQGETDAGDTRFVTPKKLRQWLRNKLSSSVDSTSTTTPASVKGVKTAYDRGSSALSAANSHAGRTDNPHGVTKSQVGLGSVNNWGATSSTSDSSSSKYATAAGVKSAYDAGVRQATESLRGQMEIATDAETKAGTDKERAVVPYYLKQWWESVRTWGNIKDKPSTFPPSSHSQALRRFIWISGYLPRGWRSGKSSL